jgi:putative flippase GtrA
MSPAPARTTRHRFIRYGSVSAISTATSLTVLGVLVGVLSVTAIWANIIATAVGTIPSFELNRRWVWSRGDRREVLLQVLPYCMLSFSGLLVSSIAVHLASDATGGTTRLVHTGAVEFANLAAFGVLWLIQFVLCDRVLFKVPAVSAPTAVLAATARRSEDQRRTERTYLSTSVDDLLALDVTSVDCLQAGQHIGHRK